MLRPVVEQHCRAMTVSKTGGTVNEAKPLDLARGRREIDLVSVPMIVSVSAGWRSKERPRTIRFRRACESIAYGSCLIDRDHAGMLLQPSSYAVTACVVDKTKMNVIQYSLLDASVIFRKAVLRLDRHVTQRRRSEVFRSRKCQLSARNVCRIVTTRFWTQRRVPLPTKGSRGHRLRTLPASLRFLTGLSIAISVTSANCSTRFCANSTSASFSIWKPRFSNKPPSLRGSRLSSAGTSKCLSPTPIYAASLSPKLGQRATTKAPQFRN